MGIDREVRFGRKLGERGETIEERGGNKRKKQRGEN